MTPKQFTAALAQLRVNNSQAARLLGIGRSSVLRYSRGEKKVPESLRRLITMLLNYPIPKEWR